MSVSRSNYDPESVLEALLEQIKESKEYTVTGQKDNVICTYYFVDGKLSSINYRGNNADQ